MVKHLTWFGSTLLNTVSWTHRYMKAESASSVQFEKWLAVIFSDTVCSSIQTGCQKSPSCGSASTSWRLWLGRECWRRSQPSLTRPAICSTGLLLHRGTCLAFGCSLHSVHTVLLLLSRLTWDFSAQLRPVRIACLISCVCMKLLLFAFLFMDLWKGISICLAFLT